MSEIMWTLISMVVIAVLSFAFFAWLLRGFLIPYLKVKSSRGGMVLVKVRNPLVDYFAVGVSEGKLIKIRLRGKKDVSLSIPSTAFYRTLGVVCVDVDEESGAVVTRNYNIVGTHDPVVNNNLLVRAMTAPRSEQQKAFIVIVLLIVLLLGLLYVGYQVSSLSEQIELVRVGTTVSGVNL